MSKQEYTFNVRNVDVNFETITGHIADITNNNTSILNLSSVIHEVYSYSSSNTIEEFWLNVFNGSFKYISIRDLMSSYAINAEAEINDILKLQERTNSKKLSDFISVCGNISTRRNLVHYLLKYSYVENWEREVIENYLPITVECFLLRRFEKSTEIKIIVRAGKHAAIMETVKSV